MKALVIGVGLQGKAVLHDLEHSPLVKDIVAADVDAVAVTDFLTRRGYGKSRPAVVDASSEAQLVRLIRETRPHVVICMVPPALGLKVARAALDSGVPFVSSSYTGDLAVLDEEAQAKGVTILPEMGMDPGIDLILGRLVVGELDEVHGLYSYGAGVPEPACADTNPLRYKITWTFDGVLKAYKRPARVLRDGREIAIPEGRIFRAEHVHLLDVSGIGTLEAYPNGDAVRYADMLGLGPNLRDMGRFALRWPGHCRFWNILSALGFLDDEPLAIDGGNVSPREFLVRHLTPRLQFEPHERDVVILRAQGWGKKDGRRCTLHYQLIDYRDLETGFFAMNRTVGFTASIAAQLVLSGRVSRPGVLSPARDVPAHEVLQALEARNMIVERQLEWLETE